MTSSNGKLHIPLSLPIASGIQTRSPVGSKLLSRHRTEAIYVRPRKRALRLNDVANEDGRPKEVARSVAHLSSLRSCKHLLHASGGQLCSIRKPSPQVHRRAHSYLMIDRPISLRSISQYRPPLNNSSSATSMISATNVPPKSHMLIQPCSGRCILANRILLYLQCSSLAPGF